MEWVETTGRSVAEALDAALDQLGVDETEVEFEVLAEPRAGFLGRFGAVDARIRARVRPVSREKPGERRRRRGSGGENGRGGRGGRGPKSAAAPAPARAGGTAGDEPAPGRTGARPARRRRRRGRTGGGGGYEAEAAVEAARDSEVSVSESQVPLEDQAAAAREFVEGLVGAFGARARVETRVEDDTVSVDVTGADLGLLVGPRGATLAAIEELTRTVVQRHAEGQGARLLIDVGGYRAKRRAALAEFAEGLVAKVREQGSEIALEPMPAADRKVVHDTVAAMDGVETYSEGEEPRRRVVIRPAG